MLRYLSTSDVRFDLRALAAALAIAPFLWALKAHLVWWLYSARDVYALADIPAWWIPLLTAHDLVLCAALAVGYRILFFAEHTPWKPVRIAFGRVLPAMIGIGIVLFSIVSWKVQQIYGCSIEITHIRAANDLGSMTDSLLAYLNVGVIAFALCGIAAVLVGWWPIQALLARQFWAKQRWSLWLVPMVAVAGVFFVSKSLIRERYTYSVEQNAVLHFISWYQPPPQPVDVPALLAAMPPDAIAADAQMRDMASAYLPDGSDAAPGLPVLEQDTGKPMNLLIILMESTANVYVDHQAAPNIMRLADEGIRLDNHFTTVTETYKAVYALMYSDYLVDLGGFPRQVYGRPMPQPSLAGVLRDNGYATGFFHSGYLHLGDLGFMLDGFDKVISAEDLHSMGATAWRYGVFEEHTVEVTSQWIRQHKDGPFFAVYSPMFPHHPYYSPARERTFDRDTQLGRYRNALHYADANVGTLLEMIEQEQLMDNTLIVVVADHGQTVSSWPCGHGMNFSIEELRVPMILHNRHLFAAGQHSALFTQHPDVAPTLLSLMKISAPSSWLGRDLTQPQVPLRALPVKVEQAKLAGIIDQGVVFRFDEKSNRAALLRIEGEQLVELPPDHPAAALIASYTQRMEAFTPWVRWRHYQRVVGEDTRHIAVNWPSEQQQAQ